MKSYILQGPRLTFCHKSWSNVPFIGQAGRFGGRHPSSSNPISTTLPNSGYLLAPNPLKKGSNRRRGEGLSHSWGGPSSWGRWPSTRPSTLSQRLIASCVAHENPNAYKLDRRKKFLPKKNTGVVWVWGENMGKWEMFPDLGGKGLFYYTYANITCCAQWWFGKSRIRVNRKAFPTIPATIWMIHCLGFEISINLLFSLVFCFTFWLLLSKRLRVFSWWLNIYLFNFHVRQMTIHLITWA